MAQYYSGKDVQQPYDTARESVKTLSDAASSRLKQAGTSTGNFINRVKQTASDLVDPSRTVLPTPGSFLYQRDSDGNILYDEKGKPVTVRDYKRAGIEHFTQSQKDQKNYKSDAVNWFNTVIEDPSLSDQVRTSLLEASLGMQNAFELEDEDRLSFIEAAKAAEAAEEGGFEIPDRIPNKDLTKKPASQKTEPIPTDGSTNVVSEPDGYTATTIEEGKEDVVKQGKVGDKDWEAGTRWSGEVGDRKLKNPTSIQKKLIEAGHTQEGLIKKMEANQKFQANRPKVSDLLKIFKK